MIYVPEFIKYRAQCGLILGISLMTPIGTLLLKALTLDKDIILSYSLVTSALIDLLLAFIGFMVIRYTHHYVLKEEIEYARFFNATLD